jgi:hypothetical protein
MERQEWLDSLKEGDKVALRHNGYSTDSYLIREITRITPKRIIKVGNIEYNNKGQQRGRGTWDRGVDIVPITQDILNRIEKSRLVSEISDINFKTVPLEKLRKIAEILK